MEAVVVNDGILHLHSTSYNCPYCKKKHNDDKEILLRRINKNKTLITKVKCICKNKFMLTIDYMGNYVSFIG